MLLCERMKICVHIHTQYTFHIGDYKWCMPKKDENFFEVDFLHLTTTSLAHRIVDVYLTNYSFQTSFHSTKMRETWMTWIRFKTVRTAVSGIPLLHRIIFPAHCDLISSTSVSIYIKFFCSVLPLILIQIFYPRHLNPRLSWFLI